MTPAQIKSQFQQAQALIRDGSPDKAETILRALLLTTGGAPEILFQLSRALDRQCDTTGAAEALDAALAKRPEDPTLIAAALPIFARLGLEDRVLAMHDVVISQASDKLAAKAGKAFYLQQIGHFEASEAILRRLIKQHPEALDCYRLLTLSCKLRKGDPLITQMKRIWRQPNLNDTGRMQLGFALAKAMEDSGQTDQVFTYLDPANAAQARIAPYKRNAGLPTWSALMAAQDGCSFAPTLEPRPIRQVFVCGTPRSGTTLVEQIIASHSAVTGGGEMGHAFIQADRMLGPFRTLPRLDDISDADLENWVDFVQRLIHRETGLTSGVVTDKAISTQMIFGLIARGMPDARLVVVHRDPRDIALSIYKNHFKPGTHNYAASLPAIADQIKAFRIQIRWWKERLPELIHEVRYEDLVSDTETQTRKLIAAAGLDWEDACLSFHETVGKVKTLSLAQVRQPIHAGRREAWRKYERELAPFIDAWGDFPWD